MTCDRCGVELAVADWPFCPHGRGSFNAQGDELDYVDENLGPMPVHIRSKAERRRLMKERGLVEFVRNAGPDDRHVPRWATMDAWTLEQGRILAERQATTKATNDPEAQVRVTWNVHDMTAAEVAPYRD